MSVDPEAVKVDAPIVSSETDQSLELKKKSTQTARVVLPTAADDAHADVDTDEEGPEDGVEEETDDGDFLSEFPDDTEDLELVHSKIGSLAGLRLARFAEHLKRLCLRQNFISILEPETFHQLTKLEELDLYDNKLKGVGDALDKLENLSTLDLSFNLLRSVPDRLEFLHSLDTIYFVQNKITKISGFASCVTLRSLELGGNKIRKIENLESLVNLEELWLGKNKITKLQGLGTLKKLKILSLQSNRITKLEGLEELKDLSQLYLSHNGIERLEGLEHNLELTTLDVGNNFIPAIENISHLKKLEELWMNGNKIPDLSSLEPELRGISTLETLYLEHNPCQKNDMTGYRRKIQLALPQLKQIDATKSKAKGINASSFFDLKAELSKQEAEFAKAKAAGRSTSIVGGVKRPDKKPTVWARQNKGVNIRAGRDVELEEVAKPTLDSARAALERKAKIYEKLRRGKTGGLNDAQYDALLVDFDTDNVTSKYYEADSADEDESLTVPTRPEDDPMVEYEDEFGRIRTARRSEVPRNMITNREDEVDEDEDIIIRNPVNHFPTYQPTEERLAEIAKQYAEENNPLSQHYDASKEVRAKGAGFYQFSGDEATRAAQMEELKASREETTRIRQELGAEDVKFGEIEGMRHGEGQGGTAGGPVVSRGAEKRKRELEERRKLLEAKRKKAKVSDSSAATPSSSATPEIKVTSQDLNKLRAASPPPPQATSANRVSRFSDRQSIKETSPASSDPFAALESKLTSSSKAKGKSKAEYPTNDADSFLAQLEQEFLAKR
ncbi:Coiled-coil domain-containing protein 174 [Psilocybe cubensis]|uniref:Protein phosphatase 1 regulatory subunit 7 n=2 Tax=Psilocybe cubensis TaxID=181762 RepID=A0A8H7XZY2_PSICU|nr:Coiled-coil domain-containing protein 174 [Psilocybe cubensis]KAH9481434.1 Coiled-coil domain-containing protein 174 [Psilocybe cubensis]